MTYVYGCPGCCGTFEIIKSVREFDHPEFCPVSMTTMVRQVARGFVYLTGTKVEDKKWQPALGKAMTDTKLKAEARARGWEEVGNERPEKHLSPPRVEYPSFTNDEISQICRNP